MRKDALGFFWEDEPVVKAAKAEKVKRTPPPRTWELPDYLPNLEEASKEIENVFTDMELLAASKNKERLVFDIECYPNYFLIAFKSIVSGKVVYFEMDNEPCGMTLNIPKLKWVLYNFTVISFFGIGYDVPMAAIALNRASTEALFAATEKIIIGEERPQDVLRAFKAKKLEIDHIDLMEVAPLRASLKIYMGRLHGKRMQDLPFKPGTVLSPDQILITRWYCLNDLSATELLYKELYSQVELRERMSAEYKTDLRSRSDAQIAESVISDEVSRLNGERCYRPKIEVGTCYRYQAPTYLRYQSALMNWVMNVVNTTNFIVDESGSVGVPLELEQIKIKIGNSSYTLRIGGLHSSEESVCHVAGADYVLRDRDVASFYPYIILNNNLYPKHLGTNFLLVYRGLVERRIEAKRRAKELKDAFKGKQIPPDVAQQIEYYTTQADTLKITINGSFGKLGNRWSVIYSPDLLIQVTITGQLSLLMLIERLELAGISVVSANTDGVVIKCHKSMQHVMDSIIKQWEAETGFETEETKYKALYSRDVNNYIAIYEEPKEEKGKKIYHKVKGAFSEKGSNGNSILSKNPTSLICSDAAIDFLVHGTPIVTTLQQCKDMRRFVTVRGVTGGAWKDGEYLGKAIRWYYASEEKGEIVYAKNGNKVPRSAGAKPLMLLPDQLPNDIDYAWYEAEANKILKEVAYL